MKEVYSFIHLLDQISRYKATNHTWMNVTVKAKIPSSHNLVMRFILCRSDPYHSYDVDDFLESKVFPKSDVVFN